MFGGGRGGGAAKWSASKEIPYKNCDFSVGSIIYLKIKSLVENMTGIPHVMPTKLSSLLDITLLEL